ncbi:MAG: DUF2269 family protein [Actinomycetota bacterium]
MTFYEAMRFVHILAAIVWVGGAIMFQFIYMRVMAANDPGRMRAFAADTEQIGKKVLMPAAIVVLAAGVTMVLNHGGINFEDTWIVIGIAGIIGSALVGSLYLGPEGGRIGALLQERGGEDDEIRSRRERLVLIGRIELTVLILIVLDMVVKPGA